MVRHLVRAWKAVSTFGPRNGGALVGHYVVGRMLPSQQWRPRQVHVGALPHPVWLRPGVGDWILMERIFLDREYEPLSPQHEEAMNALQARMLRNGKRPLIVDCGANIGLSAIWFAQRFPQATVVCVEPESGNFALLRRNAEAYRTLIPLQAAISDRHSRVQLANASKVPWAWRTEEDDNGAIQSVTLEEIVAAYPGHCPLLVKIDIEGFEVNLFRDDAHWVDHIPLIVFEMHDWMLPWSGSGDAFLSRLTRVRRDYLMRGENMFAYSHRALTQA